MPLRDPLGSHSLCNAMKRAALILCTVHYWGNMLLVTGALAGDSSTRTGLALASGADRDRAFCSLAWIKKREVLARWR